MVAAWCCGTLPLVTDQPSEFLWEASFVENMTRRRKALGMSQSGLAKALAARGLPFHQPTIQRIENGERPIRLNEAVHIVQVLEMGRLGQLGLDFAVYPEGDESLARNFLQDSLVRTRSAVEAAEREQFEAAARAFEAVQLLSFQVEIYERAAEKSATTTDTHLITECRTEISRFNGNELLHPLLQRGDPRDEHPEEA